MTLVERKTGYVLIGKLRARTKEHTNRRTLRLMRRHPQRFKTITADNGTEFHDYVQLERATGVRFFFATPHHSWERGTNENTNGLIRQYIPKGTSMAKISQHRCNAIARVLNNRPRKRLASKHLRNASMKFSQCCSSKLMSRASDALSIAIAKWRVVDEGSRRPRRPRARR